MIINQETIGQKFKRRAVKRDSWVSSSSLALVVQTGHKLSCNTPSQACSCFASLEHYRVVASWLQCTCESSLFCGYSDNAFTHCKGSLNMNVPEKWAQLSHFFTNHASSCSQEIVGSWALHFSPRPVMGACSNCLSWIKGWHVYVANSKC